MQSRAQQHVSRGAQTHAQYKLIGWVRIFLEIVFSQSGFNCKYSKKFMSAKISRPTIHTNGFSV